jgi:hypothetical protein
MLYHIPNLEVFYWTAMHVVDYGYENPITPFGSFAGFTHMKELALDWQLIVGSAFGQDLLDHFPTYTTVHDYLPPDLELFEVQEMTWSGLGRIYESMQGQGDTEKLSRYQALLTSRLPKQTSVVIDLDDMFNHHIRNPLWHPLYDLTVSMLRAIADTMHSVGKQFTARYDSGQRDQPVRLLVEAGFTLYWTAWSNDQARAGEYLSMMDVLNTGPGLAEATAGL